jgi:hypothetical protein
MNRKLFFESAAIVLGALLAAHCTGGSKGTFQNKPNTDSGTGVTKTGEFVNPDADLVTYEPDPPRVPEKGEFFSHTEHGVDLPDKPKKKELKIKGRSITCADCHSGECKKGGAVDINRPGHDSCGGIKACHPDFFDNKKMCLSCHTSASPMRAPLRPYGANSIVPIKDYGFDYDHTTHLGPKAAPSKRGKPEAKCDTCHKPDKQGRNQTQAGHSTCGQCHCDADAKVKMNDCIVCHTGTDLARSAHAYLDFRPHAQQFMHKDHEIDDKGRPADCKSCHVGVADAKSLTEVAVPPMLGCLQGCHDGVHKDQAGKKIFDGWVECSQCHESGKASKSKKVGKKK